MFISSIILSVLPSRYLYSQQLTLPEGNTGSAINYMHSIKGKRFFFVYMEIKMSTEKVNIQRQMCLLLIPLGYMFKAKYLKTIASRQPVSL